MPSLAFSMRRPLPCRRSTSLVLRSSHSQIDVCQGQVFCGRSYFGVTLTAGGKVLLCLVPYLIGARPLTVELVGDPLDGYLHFRYMGVVKGLSVASEGLLYGDILEEHQDAFHAAGGHV